MKTYIKLLLIICTLFLANQLAFALTEATQLTAQEVECKKAVDLFLAKARVPSAASAEQRERMIERYYAKPGGAVARQGDLGQVQNACEKTNAGVNAPGLSCSACRDMKKVDPSKDCSCCCPL